MLQTIVNKLKKNINRPVQRTSRNALLFESSGSRASGDRSQGFSKSQGRYPEDFDGRVPAMVQHSCVCGWQQGCARLTFFVFLSSYAYINRQLDMFQWSNLDISDIK